MSSETPLEHELRNPRNEFPSYFIALAKRAADEIQRLNELLSGQQRDNRPDDESMLS